MQYVGVFGMKILTGKRDMSASLPRSDLPLVRAKQRSPDGEKVIRRLCNVDAVPEKHGHASALPKQQS